LFGNIPLAVSQDFNQSNWHSFIACESDTAPIEIAQANAIIGIIDLAHFIRFIISAPFFVRHLWRGKLNRQWELAVGC
jgi:hypothetical protein